MKFVFFYYIAWFCQFSVIYMPVKTKLSLCAFLLVIIIAAVGYVFSFNFSYKNNDENLKENKKMDTLNVTSFSKYDNSIKMLRTELLKSRILEGDSEEQSENINKRITNLENQISELSN